MWEVQGWRREGGKDGALITMSYRPSGEEMLWKMDGIRKHSLKHYLIKLKGN